MKGLKLTAKTKKGKDVLEKYLVEKGKLPVHHKLIFHNTWETKTELDEEAGSGFKAVYLYCKTRWVGPEATQATLEETLADLGATKKDYTITQVEK